MGAGAIGSVIGGLLAQAGNQVTLVGRAAHMQAIDRQGLVIGGIWGDHRVHGLATATRVSELGPSGPFDVVFLCVKSYDTSSALKDMGPCIGTETLLVSLQNGLGNLEAVAGLVGPERAVAGRVIFGADVLNPGHVAVTVFGGDVIFGSPNNRVPARRIDALVAAFKAAGIPAQPTDNIAAHIWGKVLYNGSLNALSGILDVSYGKLLETEATRTLMSVLIAEIFTLARAEEAPLLWPGPDEYRRVLFEELIPATAAHYSSMHADLRAGKRTEIDALNGAIVRLGRRHGLHTPVNECLTLLIKAAEGHHRV